MKIYFEKCEIDKKDFLNYLKMQSKFANVTHNLAYDK